MSAIRNTVASICLILSTFTPCSQEAKRFDDACNASAEAVALSRHLHERDAEQSCKVLSHFLFCQGRALQEIKQYDNACKAAAEGVTFPRHLYERDQEQYRKHLSDFLPEYAVSLQEQNDLTMHPMLALKSWPFHVIFMSAEQC